MVRGFANELAVGSQAVETRIADVAERCGAAVEMQRDYRRRHGRKPRVLHGHLMDRVVGALDGQLHKVFGVFAGGQLFVKGPVENVNCRCRSDLSGLCSADTIGDYEDSARRVSQKRILV